ncbi:uncharacterized protein LOC131953676 [Physella acuta]|uniref:uncharacterized protein LOC131953676 n=1 Tax=Physella acuta TaxID=109671 RepID=UPI0027DC5C3F|nr:uncharacterized protein LOC131953676 [Physella acuta]
MHTFDLIQAKYVPSNESNYFFTKKSSTPENGQHGAYPYMTTLSDGYCPSHSTQREIETQQDDESEEQMNTNKDEHLHISIEDDELSYRHRFLWREFHPSGDVTQHDVSENSRDVKDEVAAQRKDEKANYDMCDIFRSSVNESTNCGNIRSDGCHGENSRGQGYSPSSSPITLSSRSSSVSRSPVSRPSSNPSLPPRPPKPKDAVPVVLPPCRICGARASGFHYGVNSCEACKGFFRRALKRPMDFHCAKNKTCDVKGNKRSSCRFCRFTRCLNLGMSKEAIKTGRYSHKKRTKDTIEVKSLQISPNAITDTSELDAILKKLFQADASLMVSSVRIPMDVLHQRQLEYRNIYLSKKSGSSSMSPSYSSYPNVDHTSQSNLPFAYNNNKGNGLSTSVNVQGSNFTTNGAASLNHHTKPVNSQTQSSSKKNTDALGTFCSDGLVGKRSNDATLKLPSNASIRQAKRETDVKNETAETGSCRSAKKENQEALTVRLNKTGNKDKTHFKDTRVSLTPGCGDDKYQENIPDNVFSQIPVQLKDNQSINCNENYSGGSYSRERSKVDELYFHSNEQHREKEETFSKNGDRLNIQSVERDTFNLAANQSPRGDTLTPPTDQSEISDAGLWPKDACQDSRTAILHRAEKWVKGYIEFARTLPGFSSLPHQDQASLLQHAWDEVWLLGAHRGYSSELEVAVMPSGKSFHCEELERGWGGQYARLAFHIAHIVKGHNLTPELITLLKAMCIVSPDRCVLTNYKEVEQIQWMVVACLLHHMENHTKDHITFPRLASILTTLRELSQVAQSTKSSRTVAEDSVYNIITQSFAPF